MQLIFKAFKKINQAISQSLYPLNASYKYLNIKYGGKTRSRDTCGYIIMHKLKGGEATLLNLCLEALIKKGMCGFKKCAETSKTMGLKCGKYC